MLVLCCVVLSHFDADAAAPGPGSGRSKSKKRRTSSAKRRKKAGAKRSRKGGVAKYMVKLPAGAYEAGGDAKSGSPRTVHVELQSFLIDRTPVTNQQWRHFA